MCLGHSRAEQPPESREVSGAPPAGPGGGGIRPRSGSGCPGTLARPGWNVRGGEQAERRGGATRWGKGGTQNQGQEELIRRQPRRARGHNRTEGPPGTAPSLPRINRKEGEGGVCPGGGGLEVSQGGTALRAQLGTYLESGWEAGGSGGLGRYSQHPTECLFLPKVHGI